LHCEETLIGKSQDMKFAATAMLLGCAVTASAVALQFKFLENHLSSLQNPAEFRQAISRFCRPFSLFLSDARSAGRGAIDLLPQPEPKPVMPKIELPKEETLRLIRAAAIRHNVPPAFVKSIVAAESNFDCNVVSPKGAIGLMQLMPETAQEYGADPTIPEQNIDAGTHYLRVLMDRYHAGRSSLRRVIAAYNAGPAMVDKYRGIPPFRETRQYVARVLAFLRRFQLDRA
jgi:soluble lytic murein transglycosylase-like protein